MLMHRKLIRPLLLWLAGGNNDDVEKAHTLALDILRAADVVPLGKKLMQLGYGYESTCLHREVAGLHFTAPVGIGAGPIKYPELLPVLEAIGCPFVELGGITLDKQEGNPKPRMFLLEEDQSLINRMGFNNDGATTTAEWMAQVRPRLTGKMKIFLNVGLSKRVAEMSPVNLDAVVQDYGNTILLLAPYIDAVVINTSTPNTKNVRKLQERDILPVFLRKLFEYIVEARIPLKYLPYFLKLAPAPDLNLWDRESAIVTAKEYMLAGLVISNTTSMRNGLTGYHRHQIGGLSGHARYCHTVEDIQAVREIMDRIGYTGALIASGGIGFAPDDAWRLMKEGADLCESVTAIGYRGLGVLKEQNRTIAEMAAAFRKEAFMHGKPAYVETE